MIAAKTTLPARRFLGFCENVNDYADAVNGDCEVFGFSTGQFSLVDVLAAVVHRIGPSALTISTWTAAKAEMTHVYDWLDRGAIVSAQWIVDRSFMNRQPELCARLRSQFGDDALRVHRTHCKFAILRNDDRGVLIQTSANLNKNMRIENVSVSACPVLLDAYTQLVASMFDTQAASVGFEDTGSATAAMHKIGGKKTRKKTIRVDW